MAMGWVLGYLFQQGGITHELHDVFPQICAYSHRFAIENTCFNRMTFAKILKL